MNDIESYFEQEQFVSIQSIQKYLEVTQGELDYYFLESQQYLIRCCAEEQERIQLSTLRKRLESIRNNDKYNNLEKQVANSTLMLLKDFQ